MKNDKEITREIPARVMPAFTKGPSREIYQGRHYVASAMSDSALIVQRRVRGTGRYLIGAAAPEWVHAIETAMDDSERAALCRAILNS